MGRAGGPSLACAFGDEARHDTEMKWVVPCQTAGSEVKPGHGSVAFNRVVPGRRPIRPYRAGLAQNPDIQNVFIFLINLVILIKKNYLMSLNLN
jgi:hypothetical protein